MRFTTRLHEADDLTVCATIFDRAWRSGHPYAPRRIDRTLLEAESVGETLRVAEIGPQVVGFVAIQVEGKFIHHLYVDPDFQGLGIGRTLLDEAVAIAGGSASLKCQTRNEGAMAFYRRLGWTEAETGDTPIGPWVRMCSP